MALYHITTASEAEEAKRRGEYVPTAFGAEGFIHCSWRHQVKSVANRRFRGQAGLVLFDIDPLRLPHGVVEENLEGGTELFPHIYGRLPMSAVIEVLAFPCGDDGRFALPEGV